VLALHRHRYPAMLAGPGADMIQFCMASLLATMVLDDDAMELIRQKGEVS
jgi:hypothetical protein